MGWFANSLLACFEFLVILLPQAPEHWGYRCVSPFEDSIPTKTQSFCALAVVESCWKDLCKGTIFVVVVFKMSLATHKNTHWNVL